MSTVSTPTVTQQPGGELARALVAAQASIRAIPHDARNQFMKYAYYADCRIMPTRVTEFGKSCGCSLPESA
jgi:hypothetical protein